MIFIPTIITRTYIEEFRRKIDSWWHATCIRNGVCVQRNLWEQSRFSNFNNSIVSNENRWGTDVAMYETILIEITHTKYALCENVPQFILTELLWQLDPVFHFLFEGILHKFQNQVHLEESWTELTLLMFYALYLLLNSYFIYIFLIHSNTPQILIFHQHPYYIFFQISKKG